MQKGVERCLSPTPLSRPSVSLLRGNHGDSFSQSGFLNQFVVYIPGCTTSGANILPALWMHPRLSPTSSTSFWPPNPAYPATSVQVIFSRKNFLAIPAVTHLSSSWQQYYFCHIFEHFVISIFQVFVSNCLVWATLPSPTSLKVDCLSPKASTTIYPLRTPKSTLLSFRHIPSWS